MFSQNTNHAVKKLLACSTFLDATNARDVLIFRRTIEAAMKLGYWNGSCGQA